MTVMYVEGKRLPAASITFQLEDISEDAYRLLAGLPDDFLDHLPNDFCDYCTLKIETQIFRNSGACCNLHLEYEYWEEMFGETIA
jgi:hypothetical protein